MDKAEIRQHLLTGFKPKQEDISTPYLVTKDGVNLDGQFRLVGLTGEEGIRLQNACTINGVLDNVRFSGMLITRCLRLRDEGSTPVFEPTDGQNLQAEFDLDIMNKLGEQIQQFLGLNANAVADAKKNSETSQPTSSIDVSPGTSDVQPSAS